LEPGLFKKVTGLSVEDFNMLCSLGVFNAPLMNDAIFKFKRYEDASLTYTGIDKHSEDEVGGWDTTIRRTQYEKLFYSQQSSMKDVDYAAYTRKMETADTRRVDGKQEEDRVVTKVREERVGYESTTKVGREALVAPAPQRLPSDNPALTEDELRMKLDSLTVGSTVVHKKFGKGDIVKINKNEKFIYVKFWGGEKKFIFPDAFMMGFLEMV
jgi:hypothetical protein